MDWEPDRRQTDLLRAVLAMTTDTLMGKGPDTLKDFTGNLRTYADLLEKES